MTNKNISLNVTELGIEKECSICFEQLLTDVVCCRTCSKWIHINCWRSGECPYCKSSSGWRKLNNVERMIKDQLKFECEGCEVLCKCNKLIVREQLEDHLEVCSPVSTATTSHQSDDPVSSDVELTSTVSHQSDDPEIAVSSDVELTATTSNQSDDPEIAVSSRHERALREAYSNAERALESSRHERSSLIAIRAAMSQYDQRSKLPGDLDFIRSIYGYGQERPGIPSGIPDRMHHERVRNYGHHGRVHYQRNYESSSKLKFNPYTITTIILAILIIPSAILMYHYTLTFEQPDIWYLKCSMDINDDHKNYNESNPLDLCNELTDDDELGTLEIKYPIKVIRDGGLGGIIALCCGFFCCIGCLLSFGNWKEIFENSKPNGFSFWFTCFLFFSFFPLCLSLRNVEGSFVCPKLEDTILFLENDQDNQDEYPDYINTTSDECENLFLHIPEWLIILIKINTGLSGFFMFFTLFKSFP